MSDAEAGAYERSYVAIQRFVRRRAHADRVDDVTQQVFMDAAEALARARLDAPPPLAWLYTVARRRLIDLARQRPPETVPLALVEPADSERSYGPALVDSLVEALRQLPEPQRSVVVAKVFEGRTFAEIGGRLGISEEAARMRFSRGLVRLRDELERRGVAP